MNCAGSPVTIISTIPPSESFSSLMIFSVPATKGIEFGAGFGITEMTGYEANDEMYFDENGKIRDKAKN